MQANATQYTVRAGQFEGPLELLLSLIESRKLFVNEISLAEVTNDYINHTKNLGEMKMDDVTSFIMVAAALILIKSRSLLPNLELTTDEEEKIVDLEKRLRLYQIIKDAGNSLKSIFGTAPLHFSVPHIDSDPIWSPDPQITIPAMLQSIREVIARLPKKENLPEVAVKKVISLEEMIDNLTERIQEGMKMSFRSFSRAGGGDQKEQKVHVIVSFLAMLELVRQGIIDVMQNSHFEDMHLEKIPGTNFQNPNNIQIPNS